jgi:hypothetical protein
VKIVGTGAHGAGHDRHTVLLKCVTHRVNFASWRGLSFEKANLIFFGSYGLGGNSLVFWAETLW